MNDTVYGYDWDEKELYDGEEVFCINGEYVLVDYIEVMKFLRQRYDTRIMGEED